MKSGAEEEAEGKLDALRGYIDDVRYAEQRLGAERMKREVVDLLTQRAELIEEAGRGKRSRVVDELHRLAEEIERMAP